MQHNYDAPPALYRLFLGPSLVYSCGYFKSRDEDLEAAQQRKLELVCRRLRLRAGDRLLDAGCGWGTLLVYAARAHGIHGVGVTLSDEQARYAQARIRAAGLAGRVRVEVADFRDFTHEPFDRVVSLELSQHMPDDELDAYMASMRALLRPGGLYLEQCITTSCYDPPPAMSRWFLRDSTRHRLDRIVASMCAHEFEIRELESLGEHYGRTLRAWAANLEAAAGDAAALIGAGPASLRRLGMQACAEWFDANRLAAYQVLSRRASA